MHIFPNITQVNASSYYPTLVVFFMILTSSSHCPTFSQTPALSTFSSFRSSIVNGAGTLTPVPNALVFTGNSPDPAETPPRVPPRSTSIRMSRQMLPVQLMSTTNQVQKPVEVQQKIPRKLAAEPKGKEKIKSKHSHKRAHSAGQKPQIIHLG